MHDLRHAVRVTSQRPGFVLAVVLTLALGIGANTAVFSVINTVILRPLPYADPGRLYTLLEQDSLGGSLQLPSYPTFLDWHAQSDVFDGLAYIRGTALTYQTEDRSGLLLGAFVSEEFFAALAVPAALGRAPLAEDHRPGTANVAVLSHRTWQRSFGGEPSILGRSVSFGNRPFTVVGVMPPGYTYPNWGGTSTDLWAPIMALPPADMAALRQRGFHADSRVLARLRPGVPLTRAQAQMDAIARRLAASYPEASGRWTRVWITSLTDGIVGEARRRLFLLGAAVATTLLICCVNLANLYLAQGAARSHEFAIRAALGAGRGRVLGQLLTETFLLTGGAGVVGTLVAAWSIHLVRARAPLSLPRASELGVDLRVLAFAAGLTILTASVFAAVAARRAASPHLAAALSDRTVTAVSRGRRGKLPAWLLSAQVGMTVVLLAGAALLARSLWRLSRVDPGFVPEGLVTVAINPPSPKYDDPAAAIRLYDRLTESVAAVPGIVKVALINHLPVGRAGLPTRAAIGHAPTGSGDDLSVLFLTVSAGYFSAMGIPVISGREFTEADARGPPGPVIVNQTLARQWGGRSPLGDRLGVLKAARTRPDFGQPLVGTVVGVVGDVKHFGLDADPPPMVYVPYTHNAWSWITLVARTTPPAARLTAEVERAIRDVDPGIPLDGLPGIGVETMEARVRGDYAPQRFNASLVGAFAITALLLAAVGVYGVVSYTVTLETKEIGIRMALGATPSGVLRQVVGRVARITLTGLVAGLAAALALARLISSLLYQVAPTDPVTYGVAGLLLMFVATVAGYLPARRAAAVDPLTALRGG